MSKHINIGLLGFGNVGEGIVTILNENSSLIEERTGISLKLKKVCDIDMGRKRAVLLERSLLTSDAYELINDPDIQIIIEAIGGIEPAEKYILDAIAKGKHVVTPNKEVIAKNMEEILDAASDKKVAVLFEGAVGGGIPILSALRESLVANKIEEIFGIVNGTTNYVLTKMEEGKDFNSALEEAKRLGYAEANPTLDIEGLDASYKAVILAAVGFNAKVNLEDVSVQGISKITLEDIQFAKEIGYKIKLLAIAKMVGGELEVRVHPTLIPASHPLANVRDNYNAIYVKGDAVGEIMFHGLGAGGLPTASAVVSDVLSIAKGLVHGAASPSFKIPLKKIKIRKIDDTKNRYYIRLKAPDRFGVLAGISGAFSEKKVSIQAVVQKETVGDTATIVIILHEEKEKNVMDAIKKIEELPVVKEVCNVLRVGLE